MPLFFLLFFVFILISRAEPARPDLQPCPKTTPLIGFSSHFTMSQHQLRGNFTILDDCSFMVSHFDMLPGSSAVHWWGAVADDFSSLNSGSVISSHALNQTTYQNESFIVKLSDNITWDQIPVLAVWDVPTASEFGHVVVGNGMENGTRLSDSGLDAPTWFDNCKVLNEGYRVRWSLSPDKEFVDIGLEAATGILNYMAFGWANPNKTTSGFMIGADVVVAGFLEDGVPFADDYFITEYSECVINKGGPPQGVCPDSVYKEYGEDKNVGFVNNTKLVYGHRKDGVSFIRFRRSLKAGDKKYDLSLNETEKMRVVWAQGLIKPPDSIRPYNLPQNHGGSYGHLMLNVSEHVDDCLGPLDAEDKEDQDLVIADGKAQLVVSASKALHYPNPPNPSKVLFINKKEAPVLRVERGVPVTFSIRAGHDVALYITSDPLGGNATVRNKTEHIYAGGPNAEGVPASPKELTWAPNRNTPDLVYYQSLFQQKMGWKIQVVDGGLSDMYNNSVVLDDQQVTFFWTLSNDSISIAVRGEKKSGYLALAFGQGMVNSFAYVGWVDKNGTGGVSTYWIDGKDALSVHPTNENLTYVRCKSENGIITFEFTRPLKPACSSDKRTECKNIVDPTTPLKVVWAMGAKWTDGRLSERNMHSVTSNRPVRVLLMRGSAEAEQDLHPVLGVHGCMMFLAWGILLPGGIMAARYLKHIKGDGWFKIHVYLQYSGLAIVLLALIFAVAELHGLYFSSLHVKFGTIAIFLACLQPVNAYFRPKRPASTEKVSSKRVFWEYFHVIVGRSGIVVGIAALFTGLKHLGERYGAENVHGLNWALVAWFIFGSLIIIYLEYREKQKWRERILTRSNWVLGNLDDDDHVDLLSPSRNAADKETQQSGRMEIQLEPLSR